VQGNTSLCARPDDLLTRGRLCLVQELVLPCTEACLMSFAGSSSVVQCVAECSSVRVSQFVAVWFNTFLITRQG